MDWAVDPEEHQEFCQEPLVDSLRRHLTERRDRSLKALRAAVRQDDSLLAARHEQQIADFEMFLGYLDVVEPDEEPTQP
jgi:hypothetical protein